MKDAYEVMKEAHDAMKAQLEQVQRNNDELQHSLEDVRKERTELRAGLERVATAIIEDPYDVRIRHYDVLVRDVIERVAHKVSEPMVTSRWWAWRHEAHKFNLFDVRLFSVASLIDDYTPGNFEPPTTQSRFWESHFDHCRTTDALIQNLPQGVTNAP